MNTDKLLFRPHTVFDKEKGLNCAPSLMTRSYPHQIYARATGQTDNVGGGPAKFNNFNNNNRSHVDNPKSLPFFVARNSSRTPSPCGRQTPVNNQSINQRIRAGFDGHYEGDISMLRNKSAHAHSDGDGGDFYKSKTDEDSKDLMSCVRKRPDELSIKTSTSNTEIESDSECDDDSDQSSDIDASIVEVKVPDNFWVRLLCIVLAKFLSAERQIELRAAANNCGSNASKFGLLFLQLIIVFTSIILMGTYEGLKRCSVLGGAMWRAKFYLRNGIRRILWYVTLAKCGDTALFALIIFAAPWLFLIGILGFTIAVVFAIKRFCDEIVRQIRIRML